MDYQEAKRAAVAAAEAVGTAPGLNVRAGMTAKQRRHASGRHLFTYDIARWRVMGGGNLRVEIAFGFFMRDYLFGVTVYCVGDLAHRAEEWDRLLSRCEHSPEALAAYLRALDSADELDLANIAQANDLGEYKRGSDDYERAYRLACNPMQRPAEVSAEELDEMLGAVPPIYGTQRRGFLVGEPLTHRERGAVYANYFRADGKCWARYHLEPAEKPGRFRVTGEDRAKGALGVYEPFTFETDATGAEHAKNIAWAARHREGRENIHFKSCERIAEGAPA